MKISREFTFKAKPNMLRVGDVISFKLKTGEKVRARAIKEYQHTMLMWFEDCLKDEYPMNEENTNNGGWLESDARQLLNSAIINDFPNKILKHMDRDYNGDWLHLLSIEEVFGLTADFVETKESKKMQIPALKTEKSRVKSLGLDGGTCWYWLRSPYVSNATRFCRVNSYGNADCNDASLALGLAPAFYLKIRNLSACPTGEKEDES